jgi:hypothetical protein
MVCTRRCSCFVANDIEAAFHDAKGTELGATEGKSTKIHERPELWTAQVISRYLLGIHNSERLTKTCSALVIYAYSKCLYKPLCLFNLKDTPWVLDLVIFQISSRSTVCPAHARDSYLRFFYSATQG